MKISVVTISFNQGNYIRECIDSVLSQDFDDVEYIVVDPGSTDGSREIIESYGSRISQVILDPDQGPADGLNQGFRHATGDVYCYINADDTLLPGSLRKVVDEFRSKQNIDVVFGDGLQLGGDGVAVCRLYSRKWSLYRYFLGVANTVQQATFFRREAFVNSKGFNVKNKTCWDGELLVDMALSGASFHRLNEILGGFRIHPGSISGSGRLVGPYLVDQERIRWKIRGRSYRKIDEVPRVFLRCASWAARPAALLDVVTNKLQRNRRYKHSS